MIVPDEVRRCVAFVYYRQSDGSRRAAGTAFLVSDLVSGDVGFAYVVTAWHVIDEIIRSGDDGNVWLRLNAVGGGSDLVPVPLEMWRMHPDDRDGMWTTHRDDARFDVAACPFLPDRETFQFKVVGSSMFADQETISAQGIGAGDDVFMTGLFAHHLGERRNVPIVRCGNIAAMPEEPVDTRLGPMDAYLIEARSMGGLSGSPVFVSLSGLRENQFNPQKLFFLLGLIHGHWDAPGGDNVNDNIDLGAQINTGIAIVVPATRILETIRHPDFIANRARAARPAG